MPTILKQPGKADYEIDRRNRPNYHDGSPRPTWKNLSEIAKWSWGRETPTKPLYRGRGLAKVSRMPAPILPTLDYLRLYKSDGLWCFDREEMGITREPFVEGMTELIDAVIAEKPFPVPSPVLIFGLEFDPSARLSLNWKESRQQQDGEWNRYHCPEVDREGWLCPCLLQFFPDAPTELHFEIYDAADRRAELLIAAISGDEPSAHGS